MIHGLLLSGAVRAAVVLAAGLVSYALLSRASAATRRFVLVLTLGAAIVVPIAAAGLMSAKIVKNAVLKVYPGFPHGMPTTNADQINADLLAFFKGAATAASS